MTPNGSDSFGGLKPFRLRSRPFKNQMVPSWPARRAASFAGLRSRIRRPVEKKTKTGSKTHNWLEAPPELWKNTNRVLLGWHHHQLGDHPFGAARHVWCPHDGSHDFTIQDGFPGKDDSCTVMMVIPQGRDSLTFVMVGDQNDAIRSFNSSFSLFFRRVVGSGIWGVQQLQRDLLVTMVVFGF